MSWFKKSYFFGPDSEMFRPALYNYIQNKFPEHNEKQLLMFGLTQKDLMKAIVDRVCNIPVHFNMTIDAKQNPSGVFHGDKLIIEINDVDERRYKRSLKNKSGYATYVDSILLHELIHAVNYLKGLWEKVSYVDSQGVQYYGDPEEVRAYKGMMDFLQNTVKIPAGRIRHMMDQYSTDNDPKRKDYMKMIQEGHWR